MSLLHNVRGNVQLTRSCFFQNNMQRACKSSKSLSYLSHSYLKSLYYSFKHTDGLITPSSWPSLRPPPLQPLQRCITYLTEDLYIFNLRVALSFLSAFFCSVPTRDHTFIYFWLLAIFGGLSVEHFFGSCIVIQIGAPPPFVFISAVFSII